MFMLTDHVWTPEELDGLPETDDRFELLDGVLLVTPQPIPRHQLVATRLAACLTQYGELHAVACTYAPGELRWRSNVLVPDIVVTPMTDVRDIPWAMLPLPLLVVEVHSPSTHLRDRGMKRLAYLQLGIAEYWQVDLQERCVIMTRPGEAERIATDVVRWQPNPSVPALAIEIPTLLR